MDWGNSPGLRDNVVGGLLRDRRESHASRYTAALSQRQPRRLIGSWQLPQNGGQWGERKRKRAGKDRSGLGKGGGLNGKAGGDRSGPHRARSGERPVLRGRGSGSFEGDTVVLPVVVVPPFAGTGCSVPSNEDDIMLGKLLLVELEGDDKAETIPLELLRTILAIRKPTDRITHGPRPREGRRELCEGVDVLAGNL